MANNLKKYANDNTLLALVAKIKELFATKSELSGKADSTHTHTISNVTNLQTTLDGKVSKSGDTMTGSLESPVFKTGTGTSNYFQSRKFRGEGDADTYYHGIDFGYSGNNKFDFHEYGGVYNFYKNTGGTADSGVLIGSITEDGFIGNATSATTATSATKATQDGNGKVISSTYETKSDAASKLTEAKTYADNAANTVKNDLLNNAGAAYDTLKELGDLIDDNKDAIDALEDIASGKANATHTHAISDVSGLQSALDGKAASSHGTHVTYSTTAPVMDGTAAVGTASTVARSDHKHPTDTSRASKTEFDAHDSNTTKHITATERTNWNAAKTHADSAHAPSNAQPNQNAFSNIKVGTTTIAADSTTDTLTLAGTNVTITPDATNDKVTIAVADGTTSAKGVVQLTDSVTSTSTTTAATPKNVKAAYDLANTAKTTADGKANASHTHTVANITDLTATATELNYMDGVTSNVQTQLDSLSSDFEGHTHSASEITSGTMDAARLPKASGTAAGIMSTGTQTIAGTKTFTSQIKPAGVLTSGHITASADATYSIGSTTSAFKNAYIDSLFINPERVNGSSIFGGSFEVEKMGTDTQVGIAKLKIGNPTKEGTAGNTQGFIQIYNENNGSVTLQTDHNDDYAFRVNLPRTTGRLVTNNEVYTIEDHTKTLIYDSGEITSKVHSISNIEVYGYTHFLVAVACVNDGTNISKSGSAIFKSNDGTTYQFPVWTNMFSTSANVTSAGMAQFEVIDGYIMCPFASRNIRTSNFFSDTEGGTADNLTSTGSGIMKCTKAVKYLTISSLDQDSSCYFGVGSRVMVWGWNA